MIRVQKTYQNQLATLFLVTTPIGNQKEINVAALDVLKTVPIIFCEDTQISQRLLTKLKITKKLSSFHKFNEKKKIVKVLQQLQTGNNVALISCAGTPLIADPGYQLVVEVVAAGFNVTSIGINSPLLAALICSAIPCHKFVFHNFLLPTRLQKSKQINQLINNKETVVCYESVHKLKTTLKIMQTIVPKRQFCLAREISKRYETFYRGVFQDLDLQQIVFKGEFVLVIAPMVKTEEVGSFLFGDKISLPIFVEKMRALQLSNKKVVEVGRLLFSFSKKQLYQALLAPEKEHD